MFVISAIALLFSIAIGYSVSSSISTPLAKLVKASSQIAEGNDIHLDIDSDDEFGVLSESFSKMAADIRRSQDETEAARDRVDGILKSIADGLIATDLNNRVVLMNRAAEDLLDVRFGDVLDKPIEFAIRDETLRERIKLTLKKGTTGYSFDFEWAGESDSADIFRARTSITLDKRGEQTGIITIFHNVTHEQLIG
jgi:PAS domain S-box-containing protein